MQRDQEDPAIAYFASMFQARGTAPAANDANRRHSATASAAAVENCDLDPLVFVALPVGAGAMSEPTQEPLVK